MYPPSGYSLEYVFAAFLHREGSRLRRMAREVREELGITHFIPIHVLTYIFESDQEREMVNTFYTVYTGKMQIDPVEIDDGRFWTFSEIHENMGKGIFTPNFEQEFLRIESRLIRAIKQGTMKKDCE